MSRIGCNQAEQVKTKLIVFVYFNISNFLLPDNGRVIWYSLVFHCFICMSVDNHKRIVVVRHIDKVIVIGARIGSY